MDQVQELINQIGLSRLIAIGGFGAALFVGLKLWNRGNSVTGAVTTSARCTCGWTGQASKHRPTCPRCGKKPMLF